MGDSTRTSETWVKEYVNSWDIYQHHVKQILASKQTAYQKMAIVETGSGGKALVLDGDWQSCTDDEFLYHEPLVHPAMIAHQAPKTALVLGGGEGATVREILRWQTIERVVMVDIDQDVVDACLQYLPEMHQGAFEDARVELVIGDALDYLAQNQERWDIIISDLTEPTESGPSFRLFTREYFQQIKDKLEPGGFFVLQAGTTAIAELSPHACTVKTLGTVFSDVISYSSVIPSYGVPWGFALASDTPINPRPDPESIDALLAAKTIGGFRFLDGSALLGLLQTPLYVRQAIASADQIYTLQAPPNRMVKSIDSTS
ncbi:MAG: fused MFS/spermidine synthase [Leptolyngbyaceae cyanobacterium]